MDFLAIERSPKPGEDMVRIGKKSYEQLFNAKLHIIEQEFTKLHKPFDRACAKFDYKDKYESIAREVQRAEGAIDFADTRLNVDLGDLNVIYGDASRFRKVGESEDIIDVRINNVTENRTIGITEFFVCKPRQHKIAVHIPINELKNRESN